MKKIIKSLLLNKINKKKNSSENVSNDSKTFEIELKKEYQDYWLYSDLNEMEKEIILKVKSYTMTSPERIITLIRATKFLVENKMPGHIVECGVWRGGSMMAVALTLLKLGVTDKHLYLYDTYEGMTEPTLLDTSHSGHKAIEMYKESVSADSGSDWCYSGLDEVKMNLKSTGYPFEKLTFVKGKVEDTIPQIIPAEIALLRLDTDWYESTYHEMNFLFPLLIPKGFLIVDDYGHWKGSKKAVDQYMQENDVSLFLNRVDYSCRLGQK